MTKAVVLALGAGIASAAIAGDSAPTVPIGVDIDGNGTTETQGSFLRRNLGSLQLGSTVTFSFAFMTDESTNPDPYNDVFRVRLYDIDSGMTFAHFGGAVDNDDYSADSGFSAFFFGDADIGPARTIQGQGASFFFNNGIIGWNEMTLTIPAYLGAGEPGPMGEVGIEFLVADSDDTAVETGLAIDNLRLNEPTGAPIAIGNGGFESAGFDGWTTEGSAMVISALFENEEGGEENAGLPVVFSADEGEHFALIVTQGIPAPGGATLGGLAMLAGLRRRR